MAFSSMALVSVRFGSSSVWSANRSAPPCSIKAIIALHTSFKLCVGILVAMPTAIPSAPISKRLGSLAGSTVGSLSEPSKLSMNGTVSLSKSTRSSRVIFAKRASV